MSNAAILCTQCGASSEMPLAQCVKCGGKTTRVCAGCGFKNSIAKNYCDKCGSPISELGAVISSPSSAEKSPIPATAVRRIASPPEPEEELDAPPPSELPAAKLRASAPGEPGTPATTEPVDQWSSPPPATPPFAPGAPKPARWIGILTRMLTAAFAMAAVVGASYAVWYWSDHNKPEAVVHRAGVQYLEALRSRDYAAAYSQFSDSARKYCTLDEFVATRDTAAWTWSDLHVEHAEPGVMLLAYELATEGAAPRTDRVLFIQENKKWVRPYSWALLQKVEGAFARGDSGMGLSLAQAAATINPRDPMARGYLCEAAYNRKASEDIERHCLAAIELARVYPANLSLMSLYHVHAVLADTYKNALRKPSLALEQYGQMLAFPDISPADQCEILLARAEAYITLSRPGEALADADRAEMLCVQPTDLAFIKDIRLKLNAPAQ